MKKVLRIEGLDCANCAAKIESAIGKIEGVTSSSVNYLLEKLTIEADENTMDEIVKKAAAVCRKIEPDCRIK